jgi:hypothetical protein
MIPYKTLLPMAASVLLLAACATGRLDAQWSDPEFAGHPLGSSKVLVVCRAAEQTVVRICQDQLAGELRALGVSAVMSESLTMSPDKATDSIPAARSLGAQAIMQTTLSPVMSVNSYGPSFGFGVGSWGYHGGTGTAVGMSVPVGTNVQSSLSYSSDTTLTSVASGKLMWSGKASTMANEVADQIASLVKISVESARKAGMI